MYNHPARHESQDRPMTDPVPPEPSPRSLILFSIGHSNQPIEAFVDLLVRHGIEVLVDVRSQPY
jgi:hypothetical protein